MWLANDKFKEFNRAVLRGEPRRFLSLFAELFHPDNQSAKDLTVCPQCQKTLERKMHPYLEYFVHACPDRHGAWMSPDVSNKVRDLFASQITQYHRRRRVFLGLMAAAAGFAVMLLLANGPSAVKQSWNRYSESKIGAGYWPAHEFVTLPVLTEENTSIKSSMERQYLTQIGNLLENGASNRMNLDKTLKMSKSSEDYAAAFEVYRKNHQELLMKLRSFYIPQPLNEFHSAVQKGAESQLVFYAAFTEEKMKNPRASLADWMAHPALKACTKELMGAYEILLKIYPQMDTAASRALESRLCWFDIV